MIADPDTHYCLVYNKLLDKVCFRISDIRKNQNRRNTEAESIVLKKIRTNLHTVASNKVLAYATHRFDIASNLLSDY